MVLSESVLVRRAELTPDLSRSSSLSVSFDETFIMTRAISNLWKDTFLGLSRLRLEKLRLLRRTLIKVDHCDSIP